jgi:hypothetical protein
MTRMLDCLVSYFGLDESERPGYRRYFCYRVLAGPGPTTSAGIASIRTLAIRDEFEPWTVSQPFHTVESGGPAAAIDEAVHYLDALHCCDHVRKIQSAVAER